MCQQSWPEFFLLSVFLVIAGCSPQPQTGPGEVRWDRETCVRCNMSIGDRHFAAQIRGTPQGELTRLYKFDDIGCAVVWLQKQDWRDDGRTEIWVTDFRDGQWLDARQAVYVKNKLSPMNYGLGAINGADRGSYVDALDFSQAKAHIMVSEKEHHQHAGHKH